MPRTSKYDEDFLRQFSAYWTEGLSTAEIGRRLHVSKNVICGLRKRQGLDPRPSPLKPPNPTGTPKPPKPRRPRSVKPLAHDSWLPWFNRLPAVSRRALACARHEPGCAAQDKGMWLCQCGVTQPGTPLLRRASAPVEAPVAPALAVDEPAATVDEAAFAVDEPSPEVDESEPPPPPSGRRVYDRCVFPKGTPGTRAFRYCDAPIYISRAIYCSECHGNAYAPSRRADAVAAS